LNKHRMKEVEGYALRSGESYQQAHNQMRCERE
jgi:hypothetical protein